MQEGRKEGKIFIHLIKNIQLLIYGWVAVDLGFLFAPDQDLPTVHCIAPYQDRRRS